MDMCPFSCSPLDYEKHIRKEKFATISEILDIKNSGEAGP